MKGLPYALALALGALATSATAESPEKRLEKSAAAIGRLTMIRDVCSIDHFVDRLVVDHALRSAAADVTARFPLDQVKAAIDEQTMRLHREFTFAGSSKWCGQQRERYRKAGLDSMIGGSLR